MKVLDNFNIDIYKLSNTTHEYQFKIDTSFFEAFPAGIVDKGSGIIDVELNKSETLIQLAFKMKVSVVLECDRSLELFDYPIEVNKELILKYGDEEQELGDDILVIQRDKQRINLAQFIYEYIGLAVPMKKLHPKFEGGSDEDEVVYTSASAKEDENEQSVDPRWQALKNLKK